MSIPRLFQVARRAFTPTSSPSMLLARPTPTTSSLRPTSCTCNRPSITSLLPSRPFSSTPKNELLRKPTKTKLKTHKGAAKRWLVVGNGNYKRSKMGKVHLNGHMSPSRLNSLSKPSYARPVEKKLLRRLLPYSG